MANEVVLAPGGNSPRTPGRLSTMRIENDTATGDVALMRRELAKILSRLRGSRRCTFSLTIRFREE